MKENIPLANHYHLVMYAILSTDCQFSPVALHYVICPNHWLPTIVKKGAL